MGLLKERAEAIRPELAKARETIEAAERENRELTDEEKAFTEPVIKEAREIADGMQKVRDVNADEIQAATLAPDVAMVVLAPVDCRLDNGELMLRADPDLDVDSFVNMAGFAATDLTTKIYRDLTTSKVYRWTGTAYVETDDFAPVRLVAQTAVLGLTVDMTLCYRVEFDHTTFGGADQVLPPFAFAAPTSDVILDLATVPRVAF